MNKKEYIRRVKRELAVPAKMKKVILSDLCELFDSAAEQGESKADTIARIGTPLDFVSDVYQSLDISLEQRKAYKKSCVLSALVGIMVCISTLITGERLFFYCKYKNAIGYANTMTNIQVTGAMTELLKGTGFIVFLWVSVFVLVICLQRVNRQVNRK